MSIRIAPAAVLLATLLFAGCAAPALSTDPAAVRVEYVDPENFTDIGNRLPGDRKVRLAYLEPLTRHLRQHAQSRLAAGQQLAVAITDIDMAGSFEPFRPRAADVRIVRDIYPSRIHLRFRLTGANGTPLREGERRLSSLLTPFPHYRDDPLGYEKRLIDDWLDREFGRPAG